MRMSRWDIQVADIPLGDPHNAPGSSKVQNDPFTAAAVAAGLMSAYGSYQQGVAAKTQYNLQAKQATLEGERRAIQYQQRSNDLLRRLRATNAALAARAYAGGVDPFSGSPDIVRAANETSAGREYSVLLADADAALRGGALQAELYQQAGKTAYQQGKFNAATKLFQTAAMAGGKSPGTQSPAPIDIAQPA
jgi:hypothetical protein